MSIDNKCKIILHEYVISLTNTKKCKSHRYHEGIEIKINYNNIHQIEYVYSFLGGLLYKHQSIFVLVL